MPRSGAEQGGPAHVAGVARQGESLVLRGDLARPAIAGLWKLLQPLVSGSRQLDLTGLARVDSAGLALLAELAERIGPDVQIIGAPTGLPELRAAYRLGPALSFVSR